MTASDDRRRGQSTGWLHTLQRERLRFLADRDLFSLRNALDRCGLNYAMMPVYQWEERNLTIHYAAIVHQWGTKLLILDFKRHYLTGGLNRRKKAAAIARRTYATDVLQAEYLELKTGSTTDLQAQLEHWLATH